LFSRFSPYASSPKWLVVGLSGVELVEEQFSTHLGFCPYQGLYLDVQCTYLNPIGDAKVKLSFFHFVFPLFS